MAYMNPGVTAKICPVYPQDTNSTMFTTCCEVAITDDEADCPRCKRHVIGWNKPVNERRRIRWENATRHWKKK